MLSEALEQPYSELPPQAGDVLKLRAALLVGAGTFGMWGLFMQLHALKVRVGIQSSDGDGLAAFTAATSVAYLGKVLAIATHSIFLSRWQPRERAVFGTLGMALAHLILLVCFYSAVEPLTTSLLVVAFAFFVGGYSRGCMEANVYTFLAPYGPDAKRWAAVGFTVGWTVSGVVIYTIYEVVSDSPFVHALVYAAVFAANVAAAVTIRFFVGPPAADVVIPEESFFKFLDDLRQWRVWVPSIRFHVVSYCVVGFFSTYTNGVIQLMYLGKEGCSLLPGVRINANIFMIIYCALSFVTGNLGASKGRYLPNFVTFTAAIGFAGAVFATTGEPLLGLLGGSLQFFALSSSIATTVHIDTNIPREYNLSAVSLWLFLYNTGMLVGLAVSGPYRAILGAAE